MAKRKTLKTASELEQYSEEKEAERSVVRKEIELERVRKTSSDWRRIAQATRKELEVAESRLDVLMAGEKSRTPVVFKARKRQKKSQSMPILIASDWHVEEEVGEEAGPGRKYNLSIAEERIYNFGRRSLTLVNASRSHTEIKECILLLMGDHYSGHIHEELLETTELSPTESILWLRERMSGLIRYIQNEGDFEKITIVGKIGNHSRLTLKPRISTAHKHSLEWILYHMLALEFEADPSIDFVIEPTYHTILDVYGFRIRVHHGDWAGRYQGGIGGLAVPLNRTFAQWNADPMLRSDREILGHWHSWNSSTGTSIVNGSLIGPNKFGIKIKVAPEPPMQGFCLISEKHHTETIRAPVFVE